MNYFSISFSYVGPTCNCPIDGLDGPDKALSAAEDEAVAFLTAAGVEHLHSYMWPDGSLYRYIATELDREALYNKLGDCSFKFENISSFRLDEVEATENPWKVVHNKTTGEYEKCDTIQEYFEKSKKYK